MGKVRHINFHADEWIAGTLPLKADERGCYITVCAMIYSNGGPILDDARELARICNVTAAKWNRIRSTLLDLGKLRLVDGHLTNTRCETELKKALKRTETAVENGATGGKNSGVSRRLRAQLSNDNNELPEADASRKREANHKPRTNEPSPPNPQKGAGVSADFDKWYQAYPRKIARADAEKAYRLAVKKADAATLLAAVQAFARSMSGKDAKYIPYPASWLNKERWSDEGVTGPGDGQSRNGTIKDLDDIPLFFDKPTKVGEKPRPQASDWAKTGKF